MRAYLERLDDPDAPPLSLPIDGSIRDRCQSAIVAAGGTIPNTTFRLVFPSDAFGALLTDEENALKNLPGYESARANSERELFLRSLAKWIGIGEVVLRQP